MTTPKGVDPFASHGKFFEQGKADMYNACEWGNYCRVQETGQGSRQLGRRAIVAYAAIVVRPDSPVYTPQQLADRTIGVPFYFGTHYIALHMLEGFVPREHDQAVPGAERLALPLRRADERRDRSHHAHRAACHARREERLPHHLLGLLSTAPRSPPTGSTRETYAAFNRAVREAVRRINADKKRLYALLHRLLRQEGPGDRRARKSRICARAGSSSAIRRRSRSTNCSAPMTGSRAGACWKRPLRRCSSSTCRCKRTRMWRRNNGASKPVARRAICDYTRRGRRRAGIRCDEWQSGAARKPRSRHGAFAWRLRTSSAHGQQRRG